MYSLTKAVSYLTCGVAEVMQQHVVVNDHFRFWLHDSVVGIYSAQLYMEPALSCIAGSER